MKSVGPIAARLNSAAGWVKPEEWRCCSHHQSNVEADSTGTKRTIINSSVQECFLWPRLQRQTHNQEFVYCQSDVRQNQSEPKATGRKVDSKFKSRFGDFNQTIRSTQRFSRGYLCLFVGWFVTGRVWSRMDPINVRCWSRWSKHPTSSRPVESTAHWGANVRPLIDFWLSGVSSAAASAVRAWSVFVSLRSCAQSVKKH